MARPLSAAERCGAFFPPTSIAKRGRAGEERKESVSDRNDFARKKTGMQSDVATALGLCAANHLVRDLAQRALEQADSLLAQGEGLDQQRTFFSHAVREKHRPRCARFRGTDARRDVVLEPNAL